MEDVDTFKLETQDHGKDYPGAGWSHNYSVLAVEAFRMSLNFRETSYARILESAALFTGVNQGN